MFLLQQLQGLPVLPNLKMKPVCFLRPKPQQAPEAYNSNLWFALPELCPTSASCGSTSRKSVLSERADLFEFAGDTIELTEVCLGFGFRV